MNIVNQEIASRIKGTSTQEKGVIVRALSTTLLEEELERRKEVSSELLTNVTEKVKSLGANLTLVEMEEAIKELRQILSVRIIEIDESEEEQADQVQVLQNVVNGDYQIEQGMFEGRIEGDPY